VPLRRHAKSCRNEGREGAGGAPRVAVMSGKDVPAHKKASECSASALHSRVVSDARPGRPPPLSVLIGHAASFTLY